MTDQLYDDEGKPTDIPMHCGNACPLEGTPRSYDPVTNPKDLFACGYRHWCPWCGDCEYCYDPGPHSWD